MELQVKWRKWLKGVPPRPIKLEIPGWAGKPGHDLGDKAQPWHCPPFVAGSTYGLELVYPFSEECCVLWRGEELRFEGKFPDMPDGQPPFSSFAPGHFGFTSSLDLLPPEGYVIRTEPHPRFFTDTTGNVPIAVPGHIQRWWSRIFFVAFKAPSPGEVHIFRPGEPYAQVLFVPQTIQYNIEEMTSEEASERLAREKVISDLGPKHIAKNKWKDHKGHFFDDKYKVLSTAYAKGGEEAVEELLTEAQSKVGKRFRIKRRLIPTREIISNQKENQEASLHSGHEDEHAKTRVAEEIVKQSPPAKSITQTRCCDPTHP